MIIKPLRQAFHWAVNSVTVADCFTCFELVNRTAVGALGMAFTRHIQINLGVRVPNFHVSFGAGAKDAALGVQVFRQEFNSLTHDLFLSLN
jgi:hypothetical protein